MRTALPLLPLLRSAPTAAPSLVAAVERGVEASGPLPRCSDAHAAPLIRAVLGEQVAAMLEHHPLVPLVSDALTLRTRAIDRWVETWGPELAAANFIPPTMRRQLVLIDGAWDMRAYRLGLHRATTVFEVFTSRELLNAKASAVEQLGSRPCCPLQRVFLDGLGTDTLSEALTEAGFNKNIPTRWVMEDTLIYSPKERVGALLAGARAIGGAPGSGVAASTIGPEWKRRLQGAAAASTHMHDEIFSTYCDFSGLPSSSAVLDALYAAGWTRTRALGDAQLRSSTMREDWVDGLAPKPTKSHGDLKRGVERAFVGVSIVLADTEMYP